MINKIIYISNTRLDYSLNSACIKGLSENGVEVVGFYVKGGGIRGLIKTVSFYLHNSGDIDAVMIGYDSPVLVALFRPFCRKKIIYNAALSVYERMIISRELASRFSVKAVYYWFIDFVAVHLANLVIVETDHQADFFKKIFKISGKKIYKSWIGVDENKFFYNPALPKYDSFTVLFRGAFMPESGVEYAIKAAKILDEDHFGLDSVKRRILQFLAVAKLKNDLRGPILCLVGPPGVGKTSLGQSIARTLGRKFIRTSLGGVRDEAEIRGHRRTYVGAMPGRIIQTIKRVGTKNPVMMLDEIDKLRADFHGDPSAAMLEVLDPEQNKSFTDHYLDLPFDLSEVFFITTANVLDTIPAPLRDRMEIIEVNGYTSVEKMQIAKNFIVPKEFSAHGIKPNQVSIPDQTLVEIITKYTREAGVRELQRKIAGLLRAAAEEIVQKSAKNEIEMSPDKLPSILGPEKFYSELAQMTSSPGIATALAWTPNGGDILFIETTSMPGKGGLILTGQLGDVMKESAQLALSLARSNFYVLQRAFDFSLHDIHIHIPGGAIPKDGPSAGVTILMSLISLLLNRTIDPKLAMTGEITLRGAVLPVGGIKEKIIAAHRAGLQKVILPKKNEQDLQEVPAYVRDKLSYIYIEHIDQLFKSVFRLEKSDKEQHVSLQQIVS